MGMKVVTCPASDMMCDLTEVLRTAFFVAIVNLKWKIVINNKLSEKGSEERHCDGDPNWVNTPQNAQNRGYKLA